VAVHKYNHDVYPLIFGHDVVSEGAWGIAQDNELKNFGFIVSAWEIEATELMLFEGLLVNTNDWSMTSSDTLGSMGGSERYPVLSYVIIDELSAWKSYGDFRRNTVFFRSHGIKHYNYDASGNAVTYAYRHKAVAGSHDPVTNPVWVAVFLLMNEVGIPHSKIDFASAKAWADWCETADGTASGDHGFDIRVAIQEPKAAEKQIDYILNSAGLQKTWVNGAYGFTRVVKSTDAAFVDTGKVFNDANIIAGTFQEKKDDEVDVPNKFVVEYMHAGDNNGLPYQYTLKQPLEFMDFRAKWEKSQEETIDMSAVYHPDEFDPKAATGTVAITTGSAAVTGSGTAFATELVEGETVEIDGNLYEVSVITDATHLTLSENASTTDGSATIYTGGSLIAREALFQARREILGRRTYTFETDALWALLLEPDDYFSVYHNSNNVDWGTVGTPLGMHLVSKKLNDGKVIIECKKHDDAYFNPHVNAVVRSTQGVYVHNSTDFPTYRFKANAAWTTGTTITLKAISGDLDGRSLVPGMQIVRYTTGATPSTEVHQATPTSWEWIGQIDSVSLTATVATITLTAGANDSAALNDYVQIQPYITSGNAGKHGLGSEWLTNIILYYPNWVSFGDPLVEWLTDDYGAAEDWQAFAGTLKYVDDDTTRYFGGGGYVPIPFNESGYKINGRSGYGGTTVFPLSLRFTKRNSHGHGDSDEPYIYGFPQSLVVYKSLTALIGFIAQSGIVGCDWTETFGVTLLTDYAQDTHAGVKTVEIRYNTYAAGAITSGNFGSGTLLYEGPPFRSKTIPDITGIDLRAVTNSNPQIYVGLKCRNETGEFMDNGATDISTVSLARVSRMWKNYSGTINEYNSGGDDYRGAGVVMCTNSWNNYAPNWTSTADKWAGGLYVFAPHRPNAAASPNNWRREGISGGFFVRNGPTFAVECSGDTKIAYHNWGGISSTNYYSEAGTLFYSHYDDPTKRGEMVIGLGKGVGRTFAYTAIQPIPGGAYGISPAQVAETAFINASREKAAAIWVRDSQTYGAVGSSVNVMINGLYAHGLVIGGIDISAGWNAPNFDFTLNNRHNRKFFCLDGDVFSSSTIGLAPYLVSINDSVNTQWLHSYAFIDGKNGYLCLFNPYYNGATMEGVNNTGRHYLVTLCHTYQSTSGVTGMKINWSPSTSYNLAPMQTSATGPGVGTDASTHAPWFVQSDYSTPQYRLWIRVRTGAATYAWKYVTLT